MRFSKNMMTRGNKTHGIKIRNIQTKAEVKQEGQRRPSENHSYQLLYREGNNLYTKEGDEYSETSGRCSTSSRASALIAKDKMIAELMGKLDKRNQVCF